MKSHKRRTAEGELVERDIGSVALVSAQSAVRPKGLARRVEGLQLLTRSAVGNDQCIVERRGRDSEGIYQSGNYSRDGRCAREVRVAND